MAYNQAYIKISATRQMPAEEFCSLVMNDLVDYSIFTTDNNLIINSWYPGAALLFGYQPEEVIGQPFDIIFTEIDLQNHIPAMEKEIAIKEGRATDNRWHVLKNGDLFYAFGLLFPLRDAQSELIGFIKIVMDLTGSKADEDAMEKHVENLEALMLHKENIIHILSHDLRSPLSYIVSVADYLKSDLNHLEPGELSRMIDALYNASSEELNMLDYLVEWARIKHASDIYTPVNLNIKKVVMRVFVTFNELAASKRIRLGVDIPIDMTVFADEKMLLSILQNLVSNAIKYSHNDGEVTVSATVEQDKVVVMVKDTGIGMPQEKVESLFTAQLNTLAAKRKENRGAGVGLLLVKGFVERNGGEICADSIEGQGTSFYFTLPTGEPAREAAIHNNVQWGKEA